jgi:hypothetical protein
LTPKAYPNKIFLKSPTKKFVPTWDKLFDPPFIRGRNSLQAVCGLKADDRQFEREYVKSINRRETHEQSNIEVISGSAREAEAARQ